MKQKVIIVEALSTGFNYINDCIERNLEPVILEVLYEDPEINEINQSVRDKKYRNLPAETLVLREKENYSDTLKLIKSLDPVLVIPGCEDGVILATRLSDDLGLPGNPYSLIDKMTNKYYMHKALKDAGVRSIKGEKFSYVQDACRFYDELGTKKVVVKPPHGAASMGVRFCDSKKDLERAFKEQIGQAGILGDYASELMVQERIIGPEFIVNTVTMDGEHYVTSMWKYEKKKIENGSNVYVGEEVIDSVNPESYLLAEYAFKVLDAIGIKNGPVHGEYMLDENGPVLIEINCRCMGSSYPADYGNQIFGHHETDIALDSYLNPDHVKKLLSRPYRIKKYAAYKDIISPSRMNVVNSPIIGILHYLKSLYSCELITSADSDFIHKTVDLETEAGLIYMLNDDYSVLKKEYDLLCKLEDNYFGLLYQESYNGSLGQIPWKKEERCSKDSITITQTRLKEYPLEDVYQYFKEIIEAVKPEGKIIVPKEVYDDFPYGASGLITIFEIMNLEIMLPVHGSKDIVAIKHAIE